MTHMLLSLPFYVSFQNREGKARNTDTADSTGLGDLDDSVGKHYLHVYRAEVRQDGQAVLPWLVSQWPNLRESFSPLCP